MDLNSVDLIVIKKMLDNNFYYFKINNPLHECQNIDESLNDFNKQGLSQLKNLNQEYMENSNQLQDQWFVNILKNVIANTEENEVTLEENRKRYLCKKRKKSHEIIYEQDLSQISNSINLCENKNTSIINNFDKTKKNDIEIPISNKIEKTKEKTSSLIYLDESFQYPSNINIEIISEKEDKNNFGKEMFFSENKKQRKKKKKNISQRKYNADEIIKKFISKFIKGLVKWLNESLKAEGSRKLFKLLPQNFTKELGKKKKSLLDLSLKTILSKNFCEGKQISYFCLKKLNHNRCVLKYLEKRTEISEKSNFNSIKNMKYKELLNNFLSSKDFEVHINELKENKKETEQYLSRYVFVVRNIIYYYSSEKREKKISL